LKQAIFKGICAQELESVLNEHLSERPDLYDFSLPVYYENFFGRLQIIDELTEYLNESQPIGIFALNKMGKTSLIRNFAERLKEYAVAIIDLQSLQPDISVVYTQVIKSLLQNIEIKWGFPEKGKLKLIREDTKSSNPLEAFNHDIKILYESLLTYTLSPRFVLFIDEIDRLIPGDDYHRVPGFSNYNDLLTTLRGLFQQGFPLTFVVIGIQSEINRKAKLAGSENAGFHLFRELFLPPMVKTECDQMIIDIGQQMGIEYTPKALDMIYIESGGHPFLARQLCSEMWNSLSKSRVMEGLVTVDKNDIAQAVDAFMDNGRRASYLEQIWETRLDDNERTVVKRLAASGKPVLPEKSERRVINRLSERYIILRENGKIRLTFGLFQNWVREFILDLEEA
jgi:hypothetical protein